MHPFLLGVSFATSGFRHNIVEAFVLLDFSVVWVGNWLQKIRHRLHCPKIAVPNYQPTPQSVSEEPSPLLFMYLFVYLFVRPVAQSV